MDRVKFLSAQENDIYAGYNEYPSSFDVRDMDKDEIFQAALLQSSHGHRNVFKPGTAYKSGSSFHGMNSGLGFSRANLQTGGSRLATSGSRLNTAMMPLGTGNVRYQTGYGQDDDLVRPMTAVRAAGYTSNRPTTGAAFDPNVIIQTGFEKREDTPDKIKKLTDQIMELVEKSCILNSNGQQRAALDKAKEASSKEKSLINLMNQKGFNDAHNLDLTLLVLFNLADKYAKNEMYTEALNNYQVIVKNKGFPNGYRLKLNMGNIYFKLGQYNKAIKMYRMSFDQISNNQKRLRIKIMHNIGNLFLKTGEINEACQSFEFIMQELPNFEAGAQLVYCYHLLNSVEKMKRAFQQLVSVPSTIDEENYNPVTHDDPTSQVYLQAIKNDPLRQWEKRELTRTEEAILISAKLFAPVNDDSFSEDYNWCLETVKSSQHAALAGELDLDKVVMLLRSRNISAANELLMSFQDREPRIASSAANNISLTHYLQGNLEQAETWAERAKELDSYSAAAFLNLGNIAYSRQQYEKARECYQIAYENDAHCVEALYNLGLVYRQLGEYNQGLGLLIKLDTITRQDPLVLYQLARFSELIGDLDQATEWYLQIVGIIPSDPGILQKLGLLLDRQGDHQQALHYHLDAFKCYPCDLDVIDWLVGYYMSVGVPEKALSYLEVAAKVTPNEVKWPLLIAACYKRTGNHMIALEIYKKLHKENPGSVECLQLLVDLCNELGLREAGEYILELRRVEKSREVRERIGSSRPGSRRSTASTRSSGFSPTSPVANQSRSVPGSAHVMKPVKRGNLNTEEGFRYEDPLGPVQERPRTSAGRRNIVEDDFGDEEIGDDLLPE